MTSQADGQQPPATDHTDPERAPHGTDRRTALKLGAGALAAAGAAQVFGMPQARAGTPSARNAVASDVLMLSGTGTDRTVDWEFMVTAGRRAGTWGTIPVPSNWETRGYGTYKHGWEFAPDEHGHYRHEFTVPQGWSGKQVTIVFEGSMTDTSVTVNGTSAGPVFQGGFYRFSYDITALLTAGRTNVLEVEVSKDSANDSVNKAEREGDYWNFGGIYRPVYLVARPSQYIDRVAIDARADGTFTVDVVTEGITTADRIVARFRGPDGKVHGGQFSAAVPSGSGTVRLTTTADRPDLWTAETPHLYTLELTLQRGSQGLHTFTERFGLRTVEVRKNDGLYVNGRRIVLQGICRHEFWPTSGRATSPAINRDDLLLMKQANINAVRLSHYPQDPNLYDAADELGMYLLDELGGWQKAYDTPTAKRLVGPMVARDVNHPSVIFWDNGNEWGWNTAVDGDFDVYDPQKRPVLHPGAAFGDIVDDHYPSYDKVKAQLDSGAVYLPTEYMHSLYDGGGGAGLEDFDNLMKSYRNSAGGFIWAWVDEGLVRDDMNGWIDVGSNNYPDGITGPFRQKEGSYFTVQDVWSPIQAHLSRLDERTGTVSVHLENRYAFTDTDACTFRWELRRFTDPGQDRTSRTVVRSGSLNRKQINNNRPITAGGNGTAEFTTKAHLLKDADALAFTAVDPFGRELWTWVWPIATTTDHANRVIGPDRGTATAVEDPTGITLRGGGTEVTIDKATGQLSHAQRDGTPVSFGNGPIVVAGTTTTSKLSGITHRKQGHTHVVEATYTGTLALVRWTMRGDGWLQLDYQYRLTGDQPYFGVTFSYPESHVTGVQWLGKGPYRVYKNRLRGVTTDVWSKDYNDSATGADTWDYPEFKGYYADTVWATLQTDEGPLTVVAQDEDLYLRLFTPRNGPLPKTATAPYPVGDISFLDAIPPMGDKFATADQRGPQGQPNAATGTYARTLYFRFGR